MKTDVRFMNVSTIFFASCSCTISYLLRRFSFFFFKWTIFLYYLRVKGGGDGEKAAGRRCLPEQRHDRVLGAGENRKKVEKGKSIEKESPNTWLR